MFGPGGQTIWRRMGAVCLLAGLIIAGCSPQPTVSSQTPTTATPSPSPSPGKVSSSGSMSSPSPTPTPLNVTAVINDFNLKLFDKTGKPVADLKAASADANPSNPQRLVTVNQASATLYQNGEAAATLTADRIVADKENRLLTATGNVVARALKQDRAPSVRADKMVWRHDESKLVGTGNVLITTQPDLKLPGKSFEADTKLSRFSVQGDGRSATGTL
jgi:LPS export ABC transporter protein LptC